MSLKPRRLRNNCKSNKCIRDDTKAAARQSPKCIKKIKYGEKRFSIWRTELLHPATWHDHDIDFTRWLYPAMWRGSGITTANSPSDSTLQCDTWLWDDMALNSPVAAPCNVARSYGITTLNSPGDSTLQCGRWLWDDMKWNSLKRPPYWNSTSDFEFDHIKLRTNVLSHQIASHLPLKTPFWGTFQCETYYTEPSVSRTLISA